MTRWELPDQLLQPLLDSLPVWVSLLSSPASCAPGTSATLAHSSSTFSGTACWARCLLHPFPAPLGSGQAVSGGSITLRERRDQTVVRMTHRHFAIFRTRVKPYCVYSSSGPVCR
jgi:hypothetical protein